MFFYFYLFILLKTALYYFKEKCVKYVRFEEAKKKIALKYDEIERALIEEFVEAHRKYDVARMRGIAATLSHFKGYTQCVDAFIEYSQEVSYTHTVDCPYRK